MIKLLRNLKKDTSGASAAEYALIVAILGGFVVLGANLFGTALSGAFSSSAASLTKAAGTANP